MERHEAYENFLELVPAIVMTKDMMTHPHLYDDVVADWPWDKETKEKANGLGSSIKLTGKQLSLIPKEVIRRTPLPSDFEFYRDDLPSYTTSQSEIEQWIHYWKHRSTAADLPDNITGCLKYADGDVLPNIRILFTIGSVFPVTSSEAERTLSVLRTTLRNRMDEERLASLTLMHINHHIPVTADCIVDRFVKQNPRRLCRSLYVV